jgi:uncharacterized protein
VSTRPSSSAYCSPVLHAGVGLKAQHCALILARAPHVGLFEVHAENYMGAGGPPHRYLTAVRERYPLSIHGVGLSIGADHPLDKDHLGRLKVLIDRYAPALFSEHLAWSSHGEAFLNDLLPIPYTNASLRIVAEHIDEIQTVLKRQMLLENPASYLTFAESTLSEVEFIDEIRRRTGCGLLLDLNNVHVACTNHGWNSLAYVKDFPLKYVKEIHLAGHAQEADEQGRPLLIDTHDRTVDRDVWHLYEQVIDRTGPLPTIIEWDAIVPEWPVLEAEAQRAQEFMDLNRDEPSLRVVNLSA